MKLRYFLYPIIAVALHGCGSDESKEARTDNDLAAPKDYLTSATYDKIVVDLVYVPGFQPTDATISNVTAFLDSRLNKPGGITLLKTPIQPPAIDFYSIEDVKSIEAARRSQHTSGKTLTVFFFFANGDYAGNSGDSKVLGITYANSSVVIFEKTIKNFSGGPSQPTNTTLETIVMEHEFGHLIGLVDRGTPVTSAHVDTANGKHCTDTGCLMYFNVETSNVLGNLFGGTIPALTGSCLADLKANGGK